MADLRLLQALASLTSRNGILNVFHNFLRVSGAVTWERKM